MARIPEIKIKISHNLPDYEQTLSKFASIATRRIKARMKRKLRSEAKHGRYYGWHIASAPGEAPASFTGALEASLIIEDSLMESRLFSALDEAYPIILEDGSDKIAPRPLWQISFDEEIPFLENILVQMMN